MNISLPCLSLLDYLMIIIMIPSLVIIWGSLLMIKLYSKFYKVSPETAMEEINTVLRKWWAYLKKAWAFLKILWDSLNNWLSTEVPIQYIPDEALIYKLMDSLKPYSALPYTYTEWEIFKYSCLGIPAIKIQLICKTEENFPIIRNILNNVFKEHMAECGLRDFYNDICFQKLGESCYKLLLVYAVSDAEKEDFKRLVMARKRRAEIIAKNSVKTVVDDELESELEGNGVDEDFEE